MLLNIETFFGRLHPLIVHLPIGFLLLGVIFSLLSLKEKYKPLYAAVPVSLMVGSISALFACVTGYILSLKSDFDGEMLDNHMWAGIFTTAISFLAYFISVKKIPLSLLRHSKALTITLVIMSVLIGMTGHMGGSLTHGPDYISSSVLWDSEKQKAPITDVNQAFVFADLIHPILQNKCGNCHNSSKKKGKLSVGSFDALIKGGKHGAAIKPGDVPGSEIVKRISLNPKDKKFMPSEGKTPLTQEETAILKWWIEKVASSTDQKFIAVKAPDQIKQYATAYFGIESGNHPDGRPAVSISAPATPKDVIEKLRAAGFAIKYLNFKPDLLDVTMPPGTAGKNISDHLTQLLQVKDNILWLNVAGNNVSDNELQLINQFKNLERLRIDNNPITDNGVAKLKELNSLKSINLHKTNVTKDCLSSLSRLTALKKVYVWNTAIRRDEITALKLPFDIIDGYEPDL